MQRVFADTGYWIALLNSRDELHSRATTISRDFAPEHITTSEMVMTEFLNALCDYGPHLRQAAAKAVEVLRTSVVIAPQTPELFQMAFARYQSMSDKSWSLTDCASFLIMERERIISALTHDRHFAQAGFLILLR